eukprot:10562542-Alexandrium_andersonii.AAC.1
MSPADLRQSSWHSLDPVQHFSVVDAANPQPSDWLIQSDPDSSGWGFRVVAATQQALTRISGSAAIPE